jgi:hypothetical protein
MHCQKAEAEHSDLWPFLCSVCFTRGGWTLQRTRTRTLQLQMTWRSSSSSKHDKLPHLPMEAIEFSCSLDRRMKTLPIGVEEISMKPGKVQNFYKLPHPVGSGNL